MASTTPRRPGRRILRIALILALLAIIVGYPVVALLGYNVLSLAPKDAPKNQPSGQFENVSFLARGQNYPVYAFYLPGAAGAPALINVHGWKGSRYGRFDIERAEAFRALGYTVVSVDLSDSRGDTVGNGRISMGYEERYDVLGAFDYLLTRGFKPDQIGLVGVSMGATTVLLAGALEPRIRAVWADSPFGRPDTVASEQAETFGFPRLIVPGGMLWGVLMTGHAMWQASALDQGEAYAANRQAVQLIHCENDGFVFYHHSQDILAAYQAAGAEIDLWTMAGCTKPEDFTFVHATGFINFREEYLERLDTFFGNYLASTAASG